MVGAPLNDQKTARRWRTIANLRAVDVLPTRDGRVLARDLLFRGGHLGDVDDEELDALARLGIGLVLDLRTQTERAAKPSRPLPGFAGAVVESGAADHGPAPAMAATPERVRPEDARRIISGYYATCTEQKWIQDVLRRFFAALAGARGGVLIHCTAGKDRTGIAVALLLALLGVAREHILADYMASSLALADLCDNESGRIVKARYGEALPRELLEIFLGVEPAFLESALDSIEFRYGSIDCYLRDILGVTDAQRERIRERFTEPAADAGEEGSS